jgi:hypothetical protein
VIMLQQEFRSTVVMDKKIWKDIRRLAAQENKSVSEIVRTASEFYLKHKEA